MLGVRRCEMARQSRFTRRVVPGQHDDRQRSHAPAIRREQRPPLRLGGQLTPAIASRPQHFERGHPFVPAGRSQLWVVEQFTSGYGLTKRNEFQDVRERKVDEFDADELAEEPVPARFPTLFGASPVIERSPLIWSPRTDRTSVLEFSIIL